MAGSMVRIQREYKEVKEGKENNGITAELVNSQFTHWKGTIKGPVRPTQLTAHTHQRPPPLPYLLPFPLSAAHFPLSLRCLPT